MRFFFLTQEPEQLSGAWSAPVELNRHLKALRIEPEESFLLMLPNGGAVRAQFDGRNQVMLFGLCEIPHLPLLPVTLATAWPKGKRADDLVVRATEAGIERIIPLCCERSVSGRKPFSKNRLERWHKLARETCQQSNRPFPPSIEANPIPLQEIRTEVPTARPIALVPDAWPLAMELTLNPPEEILLLVGPEGGFSADEEAWFERDGIVKSGLLPTVLRIEAAGPAAATICQHWYYQLRSS
jgi:16S rRNA (uracil1498-N3)-methyltransferase